MILQIENKLEIETPRPAPSHRSIKMAAEKEETNPNLKVSAREALNDGDSSSKKNKDKKANGLASKDLAIKRAFDNLIMTTAR